MRQCPIMIIMTGGVMRMAMVVVVMNNDSDLVMMMNDSCCYMVFINNFFFCRNKHRIFSWTLTMLELLRVISKKDNHGAISIQSQRHDISKNECIHCAYSLSYLVPIYYMRSKGPSQCIIRESIHLM